MNLSQNTTACQRGGPYPNTCQQYMEKNRDGDKDFSCCVYSVTGDLTCAKGRCSGAKEKKWTDAPKLPTSCPPLNNTQQIWRL